MIWATYVLSTHNDVQTKLRSEIMGAVNESGLSGVTWEKIDRLRYLNNFVKETLRLFCPRKQNPGGRYILHTIYADDNYIITQQTALNSYRQAITDL